MSDNIVELSLPEFGFVESAGFEIPDLLRGRNVILHIRSASVLEVLDWKMSAIKPEVLQKRFTYRNMYGVDEQFVIALHYSPILDVEEDREVIMERVIEPAIRWYCNYLDWEDAKISNRYIDN